MFSEEELRAVGKDDVVFGEAFFGGGGGGNDKDRAGPILEVEYGSIPGGEVS